VNNVVVVKVARQGQGQQESNAEEDFSLRDTLYCKSDLDPEKWLSVILRAKLMPFSQAHDVVTNQIQHAHRIDV
jgi:hypothetical protein